MLQATSAGLKEQEAINFLEKKMKNDPAFSYDETGQAHVLYCRCVCKMQMLVAKKALHDSCHILDK